MEPSEKEVSGGAGEVGEGKSERAEEGEKISAAKKAVARFNTDPDFRLLHEKVSDLFAEMLKSDMENLKANQSSDKISTSAKWCPSIDSSLDRTTLICESIARKVFPLESCKEYDGVDEAHYVYKVRDRLRKEVLVPLRRALGWLTRFIAAVAFLGIRVIFSPETFGSKSDGLNSPTLSTYLKLAHLLYFSTAFGAALWNTIETNRT